MKKGIFSMLAAAAILASCSDDDNGNNNNGNITQQELSNTVKNGSWRVTNFQEDGIDHTSDFTGYNFTFNDDNTVTATNGTNTYNGVWTVTADDDSDDDNPNSNPDFNLMFGAPASFAELSEDWDPIERTGNKIRLQDDNDDATDYLTLERNTN